MRVGLGDFSFWSVISSSSLLIIATFAIGGCSLAPVIQSSSLDYNTVIEEVSNQSLVTNILRARDTAPLYFPDLSQVRGSVTATASAQATIPYGPTFGTVQPGPFSASTNPTFDIAPTNTKKFYMGILNPIGRDYFAHVLAEGRVTSTPKPAFYLLVDGIDEMDPDGAIQQTDRSGSKEFFDFVDRWNDTRIVKSADSKNDTLGPVVRADAKSIVDANTAGLEIRSVAPGMMQLARKASATTLCFRLGGSYAPVSVEENPIGKAPPGEVAGRSPDANGSACSDLNAKNKHSVVSRYRLHMRSVEEVFYFLGRLQQPGGNREWVFAGGCPRFPFFINNHPVPNTRFSVKYRDGTYFVANYGPITCGTDQTVYDSTTLVLAMLNNLLNLNRDADDVPTTKAVQTVGSGT